MTPNNIFQFVIGEGVHWADNKVRIVVLNKTLPVIGKVAEIYERK